MERDDEIGVELNESPIASRSSTLPRSSRLPLPSLDTSQQRQMSKPSRLTPPPRASISPSGQRHGGVALNGGDQSSLSSPYSPSPSSPLRHHSPTHQSPHQSHKQQQQPVAPSSHAPYPPSASADFEMSLNASKSQLIHPFSAPGSPTRRKPKEGNVRVIVRVRPLNNQEKSRSTIPAVVVDQDEQTLRFDGARDPHLKPLTFDTVFATTTEQNEVFANSGIMDLLDRSIDGYASTIFAFGQTGSGKTFTMTGPPDVRLEEDWGVVPRSLRYLWDAMEEKVELVRKEINAALNAEGGNAKESIAPGLKFSVRASYLEVYNETVKDLLNPRDAALAVRYKEGKGFYVENLFVVQCETLEDVLAVLSEGIKNRRKAAHAMNEHSSRSHSIFTLYIDSELQDTTDYHLITKNGKISFVDLAGSERVKETKSEGETLVETGNINRSLLTLGNCISALADPKKKSGHIPYRDSKLTRLLADSLGGSGLALMIACVSPALYNLQETIKTLRYASRAKRIENRPVVKIDPREELILQLRTQLRMSQAEVKYLRDLLGGVDGKGPGVDGKQKLLNQHQSNELIQTRSVLKQCQEDNEQLRAENTSLSINRTRLEHDLSEVLSENEQLLTKLEKLMSVLVLHQQNRRETSRTVTRRTTVALPHPFNDASSMTSVVEDSDALPGPGPGEDTSHELALQETAADPPVQAPLRSIKSARLQKIDKSWTNLNLDGQYALATSNHATAPGAPRYSTKKEGGSLLQAIESNLTRQDAHRAGDSDFLPASPEGSIPRRSVPSNDLQSPSKTYAQDYNNTSGHSKETFDNAKLRKELEDLDRQLANEQG